VLNALTFNRIFFLDILGIVFIRYKDQQSVQQTHIYSVYKKSGTGHISRNKAFLKKIFQTKVVKFKKNYSLITSILSWVTSSKLRLNRFLNGISYF